MRGEENCKYLCADSEADMLKLMAAIVQAKVPIDFSLQHLLIFNAACFVL